MTNWVQRLDLDPADFLTAGPAASGAIKINPASATVAAAVAAGIAGGLAAASATVADLLTGSASSGKVVTDNVLRDAFGSGVMRHIDVRGGYASPMIQGIQTGAQDGHAVVGAVWGTGAGHGVHGSNTGGGAGHGVNAYRSGGGSGHGINVAYLGAGGPGHGGAFTKTGPGTGSAVYGFTDGNSHAALYVYRAYPTGGVDYHGAHVITEMAPTSSGLRVAHVAGAGGSSSQGSAIGATTTNEGIGHGIATRHMGPSAAATGHALLAVVSGATQGAAVYASHEGVGNGPALGARQSGSGGGHALDAYQQGTGTGIAGLFVDTGGAARSTVVQVNRVNAAQTTWCLEANGPIFAAGGFTTSDKRIKYNVEALDGERAAAFAAAVRWYAFDKLTDPATVQGIEARVRSEGAARVTQLNTLLAEDMSEAERKAAVAALAEAKSRAAFTVDMSVKAQLVGRQAGVIAQELQALTAKEFPEFNFLVARTRRDDADSILVVDYTSLQAIINRGVQFKLFGV